MGSVAPFDSHNCAPSLFDRTAGGGAGCCFLERTHWTRGLRRWSELSAKLKPVDPAQFLFETKPMRPSVLALHDQDGTAVPSRPCIQRPSSHPVYVTWYITWACFGPSLAPRTPPELGQKSPAPVASTRRTEWLFWHPLGATGGTRIQLAPNSQKARTNPLRPSRTSTTF